MKSVGDLFIQRFVLFIYQIYYSIIIRKDARDRQAKINNYRQFILKLHILLLFIIIMEYRYVFIKVKIA